MLAWFARRLGWVGLVTTFLFARTALAEDESDVVVVDVKESARELDPDALRQEIGAELHADAVSPDDARALIARGTITIDADPDEHELSVRYDDRSRTLVRRIPFSSEPAAARQSVVILAGNLARDEASALASELREHEDDGEVHPAGEHDAEEPEARAPPKPTEATTSSLQSDFEARIEALGSLTLVHDDQRPINIGAGFGGLVSLRYKSMVLAPSVTWHGEFITGDHRDLRIGAGASLPLPRFARMEILGVGGVHEYYRFGDGFFHSGARGTRPFLGIWLGASAVVFRHLVAGAWFFYEGDVSREEAPYETYSLFGGKTGVDHMRVGQDIIGFMLRVGFSSGP